MKYSLRILKNKNLLKRLQYCSPNALNIKYFWHSATIIGRFWVSLNYQILNFKKTVCPENVRMQHWLWMSSVKTPQGTPLRLITSSIAIKQQWITLDNWACPLNSSPKDSGGVKKTAGWKKQNEIIKKVYGPFLWIGVQLLQG